MTKITNNHSARIVLSAEVILSPGQSRDVSGPELAKMNKTVLLGLVKDGKIDAPEIKEALAAATMPEPAAKPAEPAEPAAKPAKGAKPAAMPAPQK